jgi:hypothetical protein
MKTSKDSHFVLFLSAVCVTPAFANYFSNPTLGAAFQCRFRSEPDPARCARKSHAANDARDQARSRRRNEQGCHRAGGGVEQAPVEQSAVRTLDASGPIPALRLRYL